MFYLIGNTAMAVLYNNKMMITGFYAGKSFTITNLQCGRDVHALKIDTTLKSHNDVDRSMWGH